jgi:hypothetical protein
MKASVVAGILGALALCAVFVAVHQDTAADVAREEIGAVPENTFVESEMRQQMFMAVGSGAKKKYTTPVKHEASLRKLIHTSIKVASKSLEKAHGAKEKAAAKAAVKAALADAGVADADNAGTVAWARRNLAVAKNGPPKP